MKRILLCCLLLVCLLFSACGETPATPADPTAAPTDAPSAPADEPTPEPTPVPEKITEKTDYVTEQWIAVDIPFTATDKIKKTSDARLDVTFKNRSTGTSMVMPGFWDGEENWKVRFAPTECGIWDYTTAATGAELGLNGKSGTLAANPYTGDLDIYKHGFVKTDPEKRYFVYADGTPFFYLGDTHWNMLTEEFDSAGRNNRDIQTDSHFKYIVDQRVAQGFTVYQSEPIGCTWDVADGSISAVDVKGFQKADKYFAYIAEKGLVHANAELLFPSAMTDKLKENMEELTRYWVARYAAYPVLWTMGQEVDNASNQKYPNLAYVYIGMLMHTTRQDPYKHPASAHQLNTSSIGCKGGVPVAGVDGGYNNYNPEDNDRSGRHVNNGSAFFGAEGHTWWAAQWRPCIDQQFNFGLAKDYWENGKGKPTIDYEARYEFLYTAEFGARAQAWIAFLAGMYGAAYGGADMWLYQGTYATDSDGFDGVDVITVKEKKETKWGDLINSPISSQLRWMRGFLEAAGWWKLVPDFGDGTAFAPIEGKEGCYAAAHDGSDVYVIYLYHKSVSGVGKVTNMDDNAAYTAQWFGTTTGKYTLISDSVKSSGGTWEVPDKPVADDCVLLVTKNY